MNEQGWAEILRQYADASIQPEGSNPTWKLLWMYVPDFMNGGAMNSIKYIPSMGYSFDQIDAMMLA